MAMRPAPIALMNSGEFINKVLNQKKTYLIKIEDVIAKMIIEGSAKSGTTIPAATLLKFAS